MKNLKNVIEAERMLLGLKKGEMAKMLSMTHRTYNNKINGVTLFTAKELEVLSEITGKCMEYLLGRHDPAAPLSVEKRKKGVNCEAIT